MSTTNDIRLTIEDLTKRVIDSGRAPGDVTVQLQSRLVSDISAPDRGTVRDRVMELSAIGVDQLVMNAPDDNVDRAVDAIEAFGEDVINAC